MSKAQRHPTQRTNRAVLKRQKKEQLRAARRPAAWQYPAWLIPAGVSAVLVALIAVLIVAYGRTGTASPQYDYTNTFPPVDGIQCGSTEQLAYHIHIHLAIYANGNPVQVPYGVGIQSPQPPDNPDAPYISSGACFYWLHTHDNTGIVHIESPVQKTYTLGNFFDIWGQPLSALQVGQDKGLVVAFVNGQPFSGDVRSIPLDKHAVIQLDVGGANPPPQPYTFPEGA